MDGRRARALHTHTHTNTNTQTHTHTHTHTHREREKEGGGEQRELDMPVSGYATCHVPEHMGCLLHAELDLIQVIHDTLHLLCLAMQRFGCLCPYLQTR
jgi:hypothetical protein